MTTDELRIAVAESLGYTPETIGSVKACRDPQGNFTCWPQFTTSLDACYEGWEKDMNEQHFRLYIGFLVNELKPGEFSVRATPEQRCRAWLKFTCAKAQKQAQ